MSSKARRAVLKDFKKISSDPPPGITGAPCDDNVMKWWCTIEGPAQTAWQGLMAHLTINFTEEYPMKPPEGCMEKADVVAALAEGTGLLAAVSSQTFQENLVRRGLGKPVIFLDVDGVLNGFNTYDSVMCRLDETCLERFATFAQDSGASIVLSTSWRDDPNLRMELAEALQRHGILPDAIVGQTPNIGFDRRAEEIRDWLRTDGPQVRKFVVLDDMALAEPLEAVNLGGHFVMTNPCVGLTDADIEEARRLLDAESGLPLQ